MVMIGVQTHVAGLPHNLALRLEHAFNAAEIPKRLSARDERTVLIFDQRLHSHKEAPAAAACSYYLALYDRRGSQWTRRMIRQSNGTADLYQQLPEIMQIIFDRRKDPEAFRYIMEARLDGGPGEILAEIRFDEMLRYPSRTAQYLMLRYGSINAKVLATRREDPKTSSYLLDFAWFIDGETAFASKLKHATHHIPKIDREYLLSFVHAMQQVGAIWMHQDHVKRQ